MFHSVGRIMRWAGAYRKRMVLGFVCSFFATWCTAGPVVLAAWALGQLIVDAWGEERLSPHRPWLCLGGIILLIVLRFVCAYWKNRLQESIGTERAAQQRAAAHAQRQAAKAQRDAELKDRTINLDDARRARNEL